MSDELPENDGNMSDAEEERTWREMTQRVFFSGYAESDAIYDHYDELREQALRDE